MAILPYDNLTVEQAEARAGEIARTSRSPEEILRRLRSELGYPDRHPNPPIVDDENGFHFFLYCPRNTTGMRLVVV